MILLSKFLHYVYFVAIDQVKNKKCVNVMYKDVELRHLTLTL